MVDPLDLHTPQEIRINLMSSRGLAQLRLREDRLNAHLAHQSCHALPVDGIALAAQPGGHPATAIKRGRSVLRIQQLHEM
jgi:hypothetical protein